MELIGGMMIVPFEVLIRKLFFVLVIIIILVYQTVLRILCVLFNHDNLSDV